MARKRLTLQQIIGKLREAAVVAGPVPLTSLCRHSLQPTSLHELGLTRYVWVSLDPDRLDEATAKVSPRPPRAASEHRRP